MSEKSIHNIFSIPSIAEEYDNYYLNEKGKTIDIIEKRIISGHIKNIPKSNLLELRCRKGHWTILFTGLGFRVTAVDESEAMLNIAISKKIPNACFRLADAAELPFPDNNFNNIATITMHEFVKK